MAYDSTYPPTFPVQATRARGQVSADAFEISGLTGARRTAVCANSLLANHCGALAADGYIDPSNGALTTDARALGYIFQTPWLVDLPQAQALVDVYLWVVRPAITGVWTIDVATTVASSLAINVNGGGTTTGAWWKAATLAVDDSAALDQVGLAVNTFTEVAPTDYVGAVMVLPATFSSFNNATTLENMGRLMTPIDAALLDGEEAASTLLLQWQATMMEKIAARGGMGGSGSQLHAAGLGVVVDFTVIVLDQVPADCATCTFRTNVSFRNGAGVSTITVGDAGAINVVSTGLKELQFAVTPGVQRVIVVTGQNVTLQWISISYDEAP